VIGAAAAAIGVAAAFTDWDPRDSVLFALLVGFGAVAVELTRRSGEPAGLIKAVHGVWQLPIALLLPPVYCLLAPMVTLTLLQLHTRRTIMHRRVFSAAANGLSLGAASVAFGALHAQLPWLWPGPGIKTLAWLVAATACALLWSAVNKALIMTAVKMSDRTVSVRGELLAREPLLNDLCELCAGLLLAGAVAVSWALLIPAMPLVIVLQRSFRHAQILSQARLDSKTGLLNAATWQREARVEVERALRTRTPLAVAMLDIDHFKNINDTYGHLTGDNVLAGLARAMRALLRDYDTPGRFGGEEFAILLPHTSAAEAVQVAERLRVKLAEITTLASLSARSVPVRVTVSIGIAALESAPRDLEDLLAAADVALYRAKAAGRDRVVLLSEDHQPVPPAP
jgi:diguanylate cyclase (GGDEF)-like protein